MQPPDGQFAGSFTQIPLDANKLLIPYGDLGALGAYGRPLILPDDIIPGLTLHTLVGYKDGAHLWTGKHAAGVADVYLTNAGSVGGNTWTPTESGGDGGYGITSGSTQFGASIGFSGPNPIRSYSFCIIPVATGTKPGAGAFGEWEVGLADGAKTIVLANGLFYTSDWTATPVARFNFVADACYIDWQGFGLRPSHASFYGSSSVGDMQLADSYIMGA